jgi:hypothetical protein
MRPRIAARPATLFTLLWLGGAILTYVFAEPMQLRFVCNCGTGRRPGRDQGHLAPWHTLCMDRIEEDEPWIRTRIGA